MKIGVFFALAAYGAYSCGDAIIKGFGSSLSPFEIAFWTTLFSIVPVLVTKPGSERLRDVFKTGRPLELHLRSAISFVSVIFVIYAFTHIPLAETYALVFLTPIFITILAVIFLKEDMTPRRWAALALGFGGVLLVVRPGFRELQLGHFAAISCAFFASSAAILLRMISQTEKRITIVGFSVVYSLVLNGLVMALTPGLSWPTPSQFALLAAIGMLGGTGHILIISAARNAPAAWVAQTQYSQIVWAIALGAIFYQEYPGLFTLAGLIVVAVAGLMNFIPERARTWFGAHVLALRRRNSDAPEQ